MLDAVGHRLGVLLLCLNSRLPFLSGGNDSAPLYRWGSGWLAQCLKFMKPYNRIPKDGFQGLKENYASDAVSGLIVFLLALPLSLGIAKASEFPPLMGLLTAIIGGVVVSFFAGSRLTIKGPAAGLIVIMVEGVAEFGGGETGWHLLLGAVVVAGLVQVMFGILKMGKLSDFFPLSAVHGMLAAIGLIIILKQIPVLLNVDPALARGREPFELLALVPDFIRHLDIRATLVGLVSLAIMMGWSSISKGVLKKVPAALVVLLFAIPAELLLDFQHTEPGYALVHIGNLVENIRVNVDFAGMSQTGLFIKYVIMLALVGSLESLLTVKAIDMMDPFRRKSDANKDLIAIGVGNTLAGILGGLPMISEVARSSSNVANGAKTRWANFFHGFFVNRTDSEYCTGCYVDRRGDQAGASEGVCPYFPDRKGTVVYFPGNDCIYPLCRPAGGYCRRDYSEISYSPL